MQQQLNLTLRLEGTDASAANWSATDLLGVGWLTLLNGAAGEIPISTELQEVKLPPLATYPRPLSPLLSTLIPPTSTFR